MYSFVGETVLDPFLGSGTTTLAAAQEGRDSVGYEINPEYEALVREKMGLLGGGLEIACREG
jgi:site-specific DNA-methyltransferase (adenine-specific)